MGESSLKRDMIPGIFSMTLSISSWVLYLESENLMEPCARSNGTPMAIIT